MQRLKTVLAASFVAVLALALSARVGFAQTTEQPPAATSEKEEAPSQSSVGTALNQANAAVLAMQQEARAKRLAVLKEVEAGNKTAEQALDELDRLPAAPSQYMSPTGRLAWLRVEVQESQNEKVMIAVPLYVVRWLLVEGPKILPKEMTDRMTGQTGIDFAALDLSGLAMALDALSLVTEPTPLLHVQEGSNLVKITVEPVGTAPNVAE